MAGGGGLLPEVRRALGRFLNLLEMFASCKVQAEPSLPCLEQAEGEKWWIGWLRCIFFHTNVFNYPEKASQRQRGKALGYCGCVRYLPCSCRSSLCSRMIAFPRLSFSCTDSSDAQMDKTFPEHLRNTHFPPRMLLPRCASPGLGKDSDGGESSPCWRGGICY